MPQAIASRELRAPAQELAHWKEAVEQRLAQLVPLPMDDAGGVCEAMRAALLGPGKRLRPLLMLGTSLGLGGSGHSVMDAACALEMVHAASLVLDDLPCMDDASLRRGRPALHVSHGEDVAVLAALGLLTGAFRCMADAHELPAAARAQMVVLLADSAGACGLVRGQFDDLRGSRSHAGALESLNALKTGVLFRAALSLPALAHGSSASVVAGLSECGDQIGLAFQLLDDLDDATAASADGRGEDADRFNLVSLLGPAAAFERFEQHVTRARTLLATHLPHDRMVRDLLDRLVQKARRPDAALRLEAMSAALERPVVIGEGAR